MLLPRRLFAAASLMCASLLSLMLMGHASDALANAPTPPHGCTGTPSATWINIKAEGLRSSSGLLAITLYPDVSRRFLAKGGSLYVGRLPAHEGITTGCIFVPEPGVYAIALYHDENGNQKFDRTTIGFPAEGYGFSNNASTLAGLPSFSSVRLNIPRTGLSTRIRMKYP